MSAGLAIFVKTPGHSPLKTRLAVGIGEDAARRFHVLAAAAVAAVAQAVVPQLAAYWAVAENAALDAPAWARLPRFAQGAGDLGARMRHACETLRDSHGRALLLGADAPQLTVDDLAGAVRALDAHEYVLGPSLDGGFWLFGTCTAVPEAAWTLTPWSHPHTGARFTAALGDARVAHLRTLRDADTVDDLPPLLVALDALTDPLPEQTTLADWLRMQDFGVRGDMEQASDRHGSEP